MWVMAFCILCSFILPNPDDGKSDDAEDNLWNGPSIDHAQVDYDDPPVVVDLASGQDDLEWWDGREKKIKLKCGYLGTSIM